jgi:hypothetical protein
MLLLALALFALTSSFAMICAGLVGLYNKATGVVEMLCVANLCGGVAIFSYSWPLLFFKSVAKVVAAGSLGILATLAVAALGGVVYIYAEKLALVVEMVKVLVACAVAPFTSRGRHSPQHFGRFGGLNVNRLA